jgi:hypothetical protein
MIPSWLKGQTSNFVWCFVGLAAGFILNPIVNDRALPFFYRPSAEIKVLTPSPLGREVELDIRTTSSLPEHSYYVVVQSGERYWPQAPVESNANRPVKVKLGATGSGDVGSTYEVHVIDVSGAAEVLISNYFAKVGDPNDDSVRRSGIDIEKVKNKIEFLASQTMKRGRQ